VIEPVVDLDQIPALPGHVVLADVRFYLDGRSGRAAYAGGHLPGAIFVDLHHDLAAPASPEQGRHPLPDPGFFSERMASLGLSDDDTVVAYDDAGGVMAARLVWMLRSTGRRAALLDGGLTAYAGKGKLETAEPQPARGSFEVRPWPAGRLASIDDAVSGAAVLIDARPADRFRGENETLDARPGHIPGAHSVPCRENVGPDGRFLAADALRKRFVAAGVTGGADVISYCGSGVTACHNLLALERAGFAPGRLYPGSWSQYSATDRPAEVGQ
jgi:thiosulfate/3-mercaptopyruvate sulfurtransferase